MELLKQDDCRKQILGITLLLFAISAFLFGKSVAANTPDWLVRSPQVFQMDSTALSRAFQQAEQLAPPLESLLVARGPALVGEKYFNGRGLNHLWNIKSASKSILSILVGIALNQGYLQSLDQTVDEFFPEYFSEHPDSGKEAITLRDLITMRAGLQTTSFYNYGDWVSSGNWSWWTLDRPLISVPGTRMIYSTGNSHLLSVILTRATGMPTLDFARQNLLDPLGIRRVRWPQDPQGYYFGGNNMFFRPRDLLKIGDLYLNNGRHQTKQVVPMSWVWESTRPYVQSRFSRHWQGFFWWTDWYAGYRSIFAWGHGGQFIFVVPQLTLVVVCTSSLTDRPDHGNHNENILHLLEDYIIPAVVHPVIKQQSVLKLNRRTGL